MTITHKPQNKINPYSVSLNINGKQTYGGSFKTFAAALEKENKMKKARRGPPTKQTELCPDMARVLSMRWTA